MLKVKIDQIENTNVYIAKGKGYKYTRNLDHTATNGIIF